MLDQIKDSGRMVVDVAQASEYFYYSGTLSENQVFLSPITDAQGKARIVFNFTNLSSSPSTLVFSFLISHLSNFSISFNYYGSTVAAGGATTQNYLLPARFFRFSINAAATVGTYSYRLWVALHPVS
jgi:hypothetical protein